MKNKVKQNTKGLGIRQKQLLRSLRGYPGWHSYTADWITVRTVNSLVKRGLIETNIHQQMRRI